LALVENKLRGKGREVRRERVKVKKREMEGKKGQNGRG